MKRYLVSFAAIVAALLLYGSAWAVSYDFDGLTAGEGAVLHGQDNWVTAADNQPAYVLDEADADKHGVPDNWTGFSGNVVEPTSYAGQHRRTNDANWSFSIPSDAPEVRFSYTVFVNNDSGRYCTAGLLNTTTDEWPLFQFGLGNSDGEKWLFRDRPGTSTYSAGSGDAVLTDDYQSYVLTAVLDFTDPTKVTADMLVKNLTIGSAAVEVMSGIDLDLSAAGDFDPSNWDALYLRPSLCALDNLTVTVGGTGDPIPGDANLDNIVNDQDASILAAHWQMTEMGWGDGDFNNDQVVNDQDASILAAHWQESQEGAATVPEPSTLVGLLVLGLAGLVALRRR